MFLLTVSEAKLRHLVVSGTTLYLQSIHKAAKKALSSLIFGASIDKKYPEAVVCVFPLNECCLWKYNAYQKGHLVQRRQQPSSCLLG